MKKALTFAVFLLFMASVLFPQSLIELAKKEKERRENLKGKKTVVVTNSDLAKLTKTPAISVAVQETVTVPPPAAPTEPPAAAQTQAPSPLPKAQEPDATIKDVSGINPKQAQEKHERARERVDLLTLKMNALWQQFYSLDNMAPREEIQKQISETYAKLLQAQEEENKAREELQRALTQIKK